MKKPLLVCVCILVGVLILGLAKDLFIKLAVITAAKSVAGVDVAIDQMSVSFFQQSVRVRGIKVYNPEGFQRTDILADLPEVAVKMDMPALFKGILHLPYMRIDLKEVRVVKNKAGKLNVNSLKFIEANAHKGADKKTPPPDMKMQLDVVSLNVGKVIMEDYASGKDKPRMTVLEINMKDREFKNIKSPAELGSAVLFQALAPTGLDGLVSFGSRIAGRTSGKALGVLGGLFKGLRN